MKYLWYKAPSGVTGVMTIDSRDSIKKYEEKFPNYIFKIYW